MDADSGLMYYGARYYDPQLAYFISPDSIVPGGAVSTGGGAATLGVEQNSKLTVDFHERGFAQGVAGENMQVVEQGYWFQLSGEAKQRAREPWGPQNPQALNRYAYVLFNPLRYVDPTGHTWYLTHDEGVIMVNALRSFATALNDYATISGSFAAVAGAFAKIIDSIPGASTEIKQFLTELAGGMLRYIRGISLGVGWGMVLGILAAATLAHGINDIANNIEAYNGVNGVGLATVDGGAFGKLLIMNRDNGSYTSFRVGPLIYNNLPGDMHLGVIGRGGGAKDWLSKWHFSADEGSVGVCGPDCTTVPGR